MKMNKKGFTLAELLIVIAIIAILIAIAIPVFSAQLENARLQADHANLRSAYAAVQTINLVGPSKDTIADWVDGTSNLATSGATYCTDGLFRISTTGATPVTIKAADHNNRTGCAECVVKHDKLKKDDNIAIAKGGSATTYAINNTHP